MSTANAALQIKGDVRSVKKYIWPVAAVLILSLIAFVIFAVNGLPQIKKNVPLPEQEVHQTVDDIRQRSSFVRLTEGFLVFDDERKPKFQYLLTLEPRSDRPEDAIYLFPVKKYIIETNNGDQTLIPTAGLCSLVDAIYDRKDPILEALKEVKVGGKVTVPIWKIGNGEVELSNLTPLLVELLYSIRKFAELKSTHAEFMVKGYADGKLSDWSEPLLAKPYDYTEINLYPAAVDPNSITQNIYHRLESPKFVSATYVNNDLPNLRANFVKKELIDPYLGLCTSAVKPESHILEGRANMKPDEPFERKVQVYIMIYDNQ